MQATACMMTLTVDNHLIQFWRQDEIHFLLTPENLTLKNFSLF